MKIIIVGISVRALVESAVKSGYSVLALDAFGDRDLKAMTDAHSLRNDFHCLYSPEALYRASRSFDFDAVAYTSNLENCPQVLRRFAESHSIIGNSPQVIESVRCWPRLFSRLRSDGFYVPETIFAGNKRKADPARLWLLKPILSGGGRRIAFAQSNEPPDACRMLQEYIAGKTCSAAFVADGQRCVVLGVTRQLAGMSRLGSQGFAYCGNILPLPEILDPDSGKKILKQVSRLAAFLTREFGLVGVNGIDFILNGDQVYFTEVNPRYSASMELIELAFNLPVFHLHANAILNGRLPAFDLAESLNRRRFFGKGILFAERDARVPDTLHWLSAGIRDVPSSGARFRRGAPICTIFTDRPTYEQALAELIGKGETIKKEIYGQTECDLDYRTFHRTGEGNFDWEGSFRVSGSNQCD